MVLIDKFHQERFSAQQISINFVVLIYHIQINRLSIEKEIQFSFLLIGFICLPFYHNHHNKQAQM